MFGAVRPASPRHQIHRFPLPQVNCLCARSQARIHSAWVYWQRQPDHARSVEQAEKAEEGEAGADVQWYCCLLRWWWWPACN